MSAPAISIIIPSFNAGTTIGQTMTSIARQEYQDYEILLVDGASADDTVAQAKATAPAGRLKVICERDKGIYDAMNKGIQAAKGHWLYFLGADDELYDGQVLAEVMRAAAATEADVIYGNVWFTDEQIVYGGRYSRYKLLIKNISHQAIFYKKDLFTRFGLYDLKYRLLADYAFNLRWFAARGIKAVHLDRIIANFAQTGASSNNRDLVFKKDRGALVRAHFPYHQYLFALLVVPWIDFFTNKLFGKSHKGLQTKTPLL